MTTATATFPNRSEFEQLFQRSQRRAYNLAYRLTGNVADAEDVTQDAYVRAMDNFATYDATRSFEGWLFRIITNRVIDMRRRQKRVPIYSLDNPLRGEDDGQPLSHEFASEGSDPAEILLGPVMEERLQKALGELPDDYRIAVLLCDVEQRSYQDIAQVMDCAIGTVRSRIHRARLMLRRSLEAENAPPKPRRSSRRLKEEYAAPYGGGRLVAQ